MRRPRIRTILAHSVCLLAGLGAAAAALAQSPGAPTAAVAESSSAGFPLKLDPRLGEANAQQGEGRPAFGRGDRLSGRTGRETTLEGDAELRKPGTVVRADRLTYYEADDE